MPSMMAVMSSGINIMQVRIARSRLAGEPADVLLTPLLSSMGLMDYHRGREAIEEGRAAVERMLPALEFALR
jgi:NTE family protein